jgi:hypothetical protein
MSIYLSIAFIVAIGCSLFMFVTALSHARKTRVRVSIVVWDVYSEEVTTSYDRLLPAAFVHALVRKVSRGEITERGDAAAASRAF